LYHIASSLYSNLAFRLPQRNQSVAYKKSVMFYFKQKESLQEKNTKYRKTLKVLAKNRTNYPYSLNISQTKQ
jgi:hypothetical protein